MMESFVSKPAFTRSVCAPRAMSSSMGRKSTFSAKSRRVFPERNRFDRAEALRLFTVGSAWFSSEEDQKGAITTGQLADLAVLSADYFSIPEEDIKHLESILTVVGGKVVYASAEFSKLAPPPLQVSPDWSPVKRYGGYQQSKNGVVGAPR